MSDTGELASLLRLGDEQWFTLDDMMRWGNAVGAQLPPHSVLLLRGDLGAGKTTLARALCEGAGVANDSAVTSPTFAIVQEYQASSGIILHADLYRLRGDRDLDALGWDELLASSMLAIVEWPDRAERGWPIETFDIQLHIADGGQARIIRVTVVA